MIDSTSFSIGGKSSMNSCVLKAVTVHISKFGFSSKIEAFPFTKSQISFDKRVVTEPLLSEILTLINFFFFVVGAAGCSVG